MKRLALIALALLPALPTAPGSAAEPPGAGPGAGGADGALLGGAYTLDIGISYHAALFHWLDSLAGLVGPGLTGGKTVPAHRDDYVGRFGPASAREGELLRGFAAARRGFAARAPAGKRQALTLAFLEAPTMGRALDALEELLEPDQAASMRAALIYFDRRYRVVWKDGAIPRRFRREARADARRRGLERFLARVAAFYGVSPAELPRPRLLVVPVPAGRGTHAQAIGRNLLLEVRDGEGLLDEVSPIVHENAHFLFHGIDAARRQALRTYAAGLGPRGLEAWYVLLEALPTALGQGVAGERFQREAWSRRRGWYHTRPVDRYAKRIYPLVRRALARGGRFDERFLDRAIPLYEPQPDPAAHADGAATPR